MSSRIAVVTGGNKGIGLAIVRNLALQYPSSPLASGPLLIYLTARDKTRGEQAVQDIQDDEALAKAKALERHGGQTSVQYYPLDIADKQSINGLVAEMIKRHPDGIDFVVNNAGIALQGFDSDVVEKTFAVNYYGTLEACQNLLPIIRQNGRLVNVASMAGKLSKYSPENQERFHSVKTLDDVETLAQDFKRAVAAGKEKEEGWLSAAYATSKALCIAMTKVLATQAQKKPEKVLVNSCCPGWVATDMSKHKGTKTPDQGAETPVLLALQDIGAVTGEFWENGKVSKW